MDRLEAIKRLNQIINEGVEGLIKKGIISENKIKKIRYPVNVSEHKSRQNLTCMKSSLSLSSEPVRDPTQVRGLSPSEIVSVQALVSFRAHQSHFTESMIVEFVKARFGVGQVEALESRYYTSIIEFLVDCDFRKLVN